MQTKSLNDITDFESLVDQYQDRLFRFAYMRIGSRGDAEDLVQDVLVALYRKLSTDGFISDAEHYLLRSIQNKCVDYFRRNKMQFVDLEEASEMAGIEDKEIFDEYIRIKRLLDDLPIEQAEIIRLKCYDELTFRQIAALQDISEATAKSRYRYGLKRLKDKFDNL